MENRILIIKSSTGTSVIGPVSLETAKKGQKEIIKKVGHGSTVIIDKLQTFEDYIQSLN